ncbi:MAG TPA: LTA synthase family protein [Burkholderiaceae bacterium]|nr:LTA synthase family protein [Burkholderiaceae bacterium]
MLLAFLALSTATRIGLAFFNAELAAFSPPRVAGWLVVGALFDVGVATFVCLPFAFLAWLTPATPRARWPFALAGGVLALATLGVIVFVAAAEFVFWNEFDTRFNFIAVDYLVYTNEVIGNIRESYPLPLLLAAVGVATFAVFAALARALWRAAAASGARFAVRTRAMLVLAALPAVAFVGLDARYKDFTRHAPSAQLAGNGWFEFFHAFRHNEIDYPQFYRTLPLAQVLAVMRDEYEEAETTAHFVEGAQLAIERDVVAPGPAKHLNVVLISVESLSADFMAAFGNAKNLTPRLDALAAEGMLFTRFYATGTRTVRGLEAITLSLPPTPGHSVVKRPDNAGLYTLGEVFAERGYEPIYLYGGYSYFDNMKAFFGGNGYTVIDRASLAKDEITYENIWGVADEDLFKLSLRELDQRHHAGRPFFAHIMTTSNHRPFTYPAGRIDIPPATGRDGAVKYTDWAIGRFIDQARARPWFDDTLFVILADHCAASRGKTELPIERFHIPLIVYAPKHVPAQRIDSLASQIDVGPTVLGLLGFSYRSRFFGQDILTEGQHHQRALFGNYQTVGHLEDDMLVELRPKGRYRILSATTGAELPGSARTRHALEETIAYYQLASQALRSGSLRLAAAGAAGDAQLESRVPN